MPRLCLVAFAAVVASNWSSAQAPAHLSHVPPGAPAKVANAFALTPTLAKPIDAGSHAKTQKNLKQLGLGLHNYHDAYIAFPATAVADKQSKPLLSSRVAVLPYIDHGALYKKFNLGEAWDSEYNAKALKDNPMPAVFALPGVTQPGDTDRHFRVFVGTGAAFEPPKPLSMTAFTDGTSNTLLVVTAAKAVPWTKPDELAFDPKATDADLKKLLRLDGDGYNVLFADGTAAAEKC